MKKIKLSPRLAFTLAQCGVFVRSGGYNWRNYDSYGEYLAQGPYPGNIRNTSPFNYDSFLYHQKRGWSIEVVKEKKYIIAKAGHIYEQPSDNIIASLVDTKTKSYISLTDEKAKKIEDILNS